MLKMRPFLWKWLCLISWVSLLLYTLFQQQWQQSQITTTYSPLLYIPMHQYNMCMATTTHASNRTMTTIDLMVIIPQYKNVKMCVQTVRNSIRRQSNRYNVQYYILNQDPTYLERLQLEGQLLEFKSFVHTLSFPQQEVVGGTALFKMFKMANILGTLLQPNLMLFMDTDTFVLQMNWDALVVEQFSNISSLVLAAINPRSSSSHFHNNAEWNWMIIRFAFYQPRLHEWDGHGIGSSLFHDWGHWFTYQARTFNRTVYLWDQFSFPLDGRSPMMVQNNNHNHTHTDNNKSNNNNNNNNNNWVLHLFYSSRKHNEQAILVKNNEMKFIPNDTEKDNLIQWAIQTAIDQ